MESNGAPNRLVRRVLRLAVLLVALRASACTTEAVVGVTIVEIDVAPATAVVMRNDSVRLSAVVRDEQGAILDGALVTWSSDRPSVVAVSPAGVASGLRVGPATVIATLGDVEGKARITVISDGTLEAEPSEVEFRAAVFGRTPDEVDVEVRDAGGGSLEELDVDVDYEPGTERDWLDVDEQRRDDHFELELEADPRGLLPGSYQATLLVAAPASLRDPLAIPVTLTVAGILVVESGGETVVEPSNGSSDRLDVALELQPASAVVLEVESSDPDVDVSPPRLSFGPGDWNQPKTVTVTPDGPAGGTSKEAEVRIEVDRAESDQRFHAVDPVRVPVRVAGRPAGLTVTETSGSTVAREGRESDLLHVSLESRPDSRVIVEVDLDERRDARVSPTSIEIEPAEWGERVTVAFRAVNDRDDDGDQTRLIVFRIDDETDDPAYRDLAPVVIEARTIDNDSGRGRDDDSSGPGGGDDDDDSGPGGDDDDDDGEDGGEDDD